MKTHHELACVILATLASVIPMLGIYFTGLVYLPVFPDIARIALVTYPTMLLQLLFYHGFRAIIFGNEYIEDKIAKREAKLRKAMHPPEE